ncbi:hypothetical protein [Mycobacterium sp. NPDC004974]
MTFPNGPFGQGFPDQPGYPPQPGYPQQPGFPPMLGQPQQPGFPQQPGYPGGQPPYALASGEPSGATGMIAATLAGLGGVLGVGAGAVAVFGLVAIGSLRHASGGTYALMVVSMLLSIIFGLTLLVGAVLLFQRKMIGRWLVVGGCAVAILGGLVSFGFRCRPGKRLQQLYRRHQPTVAGVAHLPHRDTRVGLAAIDWGMDRSEAETGCAPALPAVSGLVTLADLRIRMCGYALLPRSEPQ